MPIGSVPLVPGIWASDSNPVRGRIDTVAKQTTVLDPKNIGVPDKPKYKMLDHVWGVEHPTNRRRIAEYPLRRGETFIPPFAKTISLIEDDPRSGRFSGTELNIDFFQDTDAAPIVFDDHRNCCFVASQNWPIRTAEEHCAFHFPDDTLVASDSEPSNYNQTSGEIYQGYISRFRLLAKAQNIQVFQIVGIGVAVGFVGMFLFQWEGIGAVLGVILMISGFVVSVYGPFFVSRF